MKKLKGCLLGICVMTLALSKTVNAAEAVTQITVTVTDDNPSDTNEDTSNKNQSSSGNNTTITYPDESREENKSTTQSEEKTSNTTTITDNTTTKNKLEELKKQLEQEMAKQEKKAESGKQTQTQTDKDSVIEEATSVTKQETSKASGNTGVGDDNSSNSNNGSNSSNSSNGSNKGSGDDSLKSWIEYADEPIDDLDIEWLDSAIEVPGASNDNAIDLSESIGTSEGEYSGSSTALDGASTWSSDATTEGSEESTVEVTQETPTKKRGIRLQGTVGEKIQEIVGGTEATLQKIGTYVSSTEGVPVAATVGGGSLVSLAVAAILKLKRKG